MAIRSESDVFMYGRAEFVNNSAGISGGGVFASYAQVAMNGSNVFVNNSASVSGGAITGERSSFNITSSEVSSIDQLGDKGFNRGSTGRTAFIGNVARNGGGAMNITEYGSLLVSKSIFLLNKADFGGAVYIAEPSGEGSEFSECTFDGNEGSDGGAVYMYTGTSVDVVTSSVFRDNLAEFSGGAIFHTGSLNVSDTSFLSNKAGADGPAVMSIGRLEELSDVCFSGNAYHCRAGEYGYLTNEEGSNSSVCFDAVCERCSSGGVDVVRDYSVQCNGFPVCEKAPSGSTASSSGTTVETLVLEKGYYRTSNQSRVVLECHLTDACVGGIDLDSICAVGYMGPYCAVCTKGFAPGIAYSCRECSASANKLALGVSMVVGLAVLLVAALLFWHLGSVANERNERTGEGTEITHTPSGPTRWSCQNRPVNILPLTAIKIVVTVWQIVYQFAAIAGDVYPEAYTNFVFKLIPVNLDIGFMLSYSCIVTVDFYDRLLIATIMPPLLLVTLVGSYYVGKNRNRNSELAISVVKRRHQSAALLFAFWVYSSASYTVFQTFSCDDLDDGKAYLRADYSLQCSTTRHNTFKTYAWVMVCVYPVGIPVVFAWCLARNRGDLTKSDRETLPQLESLNTLWAAYRPARYWFELVECARRITLTGIAAFVLPNSTAQISIVLLVAVVFVFISESIGPFQKGVDANLYRWGNGVIVASLYVALLLKVDLADESEQSISAFSGVLIAANVVLIIAVLVQTVLLGKEWRVVRSAVRPVDTPVRRSNSL